MSGSASKSSVFSAMMDVHKLRSKRAAMEEDEVFEPSIKKKKILKQLNSNTPEQELSRVREESPGGTYWDEVGSEEEGSYKSEEELQKEIFGLRQALFKEKRKSDFYKNHNNLIPLEISKDKSSWAEQFKQLQLEASTAFIEMNIFKRKLEGGHIEWKDFEKLVKEYEKDT